MHHKSFIVDPATIFFTLKGSTRLIIGKMFAIV